MSSPGVPSGPKEINCCRFALASLKPYYYRNYKAPGEICRATPSSSGNTVFITPTGWDENISYRITNKKIRLIWWRISFWFQIFINPPATLNIFSMNGSRFFTCSLTDYLVYLLRYRLILIVCTVNFWILKFNSILEVYFAFHYFGSKFLFLSSNTFSFAN